MYNSGDEQSEDGELRRSPEAPRRQPSFSNFEEDDHDSLDIKPPQAKVTSTQSSRRKHKEHVHHKHSERHHEGVHRSREKHHRERQRKAEQHLHRVQRNREHYYKEQQRSEEYKHEVERRKGREEQEFEHKHRSREERHRHSKKHERNEEKHLDEAALNDMRERLLNKRKSEHRYKHKEYEAEEALEGEAGVFVKEIINISTNRRDDLTEEERVEQELRKEKLLEAQREMERLKEQSKIERERRHLEKSLKRKAEEEDYYNKRAKAEIVTVSSGDEVEEDDENDYEEEEEERELEQSEKESSYEESENRSNSEAEEDEDSRSSERTTSPNSEEEEKEGENVREEDEQVERNHADEEEYEDKFEETLPPYFPAIQGCRSVSEFQVLNKIEEGTYGVVYRAKDKRTDETVALKRLKMEREKEGFPITSLREINTLLKGQHPNIVTVREIVFGSMDKIFIVMDYVEHDLKSLMEIMRHKKQNFIPGEVKCLLQQLLLAVAHLHDNWILHRDLKTSNLLLSHKGILKVGDFGLAREYGSPLKAYTPIVVTLWYRAPELLLNTKEYSTPIDIWSVGCIFAEFLLMNALFPGKSEVEQLNKVFKILGTPNDKIWPGYNNLPVVKKIKFNDFPGSNLRQKFQMLSESGLSLLTKFLTYDPAQRITAEEALKHSYFREPPLPIDPAMFPTWPAKSELGLKRALAASPKPPSGGGEYKKLGDDDGFKITTGFEERRVGAGFSLKFW